MKVLVFGDDTGPCLAVARSLGRRGAEVHFTTQSGGGAASHSRYVNATHVLPLYVGDGSEWLRTLRQLCSEHGFALLVPTSDSSLEQLLRHRSDLRDIELALPNEAAAACFTDKLLTRQLAEDHAVPIAEGSTIELAGGIPRLARELELPVVLKRRKSYECGDPDQKSEVRLVDTGIDLQRALATGRFDFAESFVPDFCRGLSVLARDGKVLVAHQHRRLNQQHSTGPGSLRISEACDPQLLEWTRKLAAATRLTGVAMFEFRHDPRSGQTVLLEVNPRFWGSLPLAVAAGADFPALLSLMILDHCDPSPAIGSRPGVVKLNVESEWYSLSAAVDQANGWLDRVRCFAQAARLAFHLFWGRRIDSWAADDPVPFLIERRQLLRDLTNAFRKRVGGFRLGNPQPAE